MIPILTLIALQALVFTSVGIAVRMQYSLFRGFDFIIAAVIVVSGEVFLTAAHQGTTFSVALGTIFAVAIGVGITVTWNLGVDHVFGGVAALGSILFVSSLGASTAISGIVGAVRGPGLRQLPASTPAVYRQLADSSLYGLSVTSLALVALFVWTTRPSGLAAALWTQSEEFAREIGITRRSLAVPAGIVSGGLAAIVGSYYAFSNGSTPEGGVTVFLYGTATALLLPSGTLCATAISGVVLGGLYVLIQLLVSPALANLVLFALAMTILLVRGSSRSAENVR